jgi:hypothetical protein
MSWGRGCDGGEYRDGNRQTEKFFAGVIERHPSSPFDKVDSHVKDPARAQATAQWEHNMKVRGLQPGPEATSPVPG